MILEKRKGNRVLFFFLSLSLERPTTPTPVQSDVERNFNLYGGDSTLKEIFCKKVTSSLSADFQGAKCDPFFADESTQHKIQGIQLPNVISDVQQTEEKPQTEKKKKYRKRNI